MGSNALRTILPIALSLAAPGIGSALGITSGLGTAALGAGLGGLSSAVTGGNPLTGAISGGIGSSLSGLLGGGTSAFAGGGTASGLSSGATGLASGAGGMLSPASSGLSSLLGGGGISQYAQPISNIYSGIQASNAQDDMRNQLLEAQGRSEAALAPFVANGTRANNSLAASLEQGFNPGDLSSDPGYQFNLQEGNRALDRRQAASGNYFSGSALREAQNYGQGLANTTYNDAYNRWLANNNQLAGASGAGLQAVGAANQVNDNVGNVNANATLGQSNVLNSTLSSLMGGGIGGFNRDGTQTMTDAEKRRLGLI